MQWWGALTKQFTELATTAMKDNGADAARQMAGAALKTSFDAAAPAARRKPAAKKKPAANKVAARR